jgi:membrane protease subunit HflC
MPAITKGRSVLEKEIFEKGREKLREFGIELLDVRFKRINYNQSVRVRIYERMTSERKQIAERFRSEGAGEAAKIMGGMEKELKKIESEAYKRVQTIEGDADAQATEIYAQAYNQSAESAEFYEFVRTMELYGDILGGKSTVVLSTNSDLFKYLKRIEPEGASVVPPAVESTRSVVPTPRAKPAEVKPEVEVESAEAPVPGGEAAPEEAAPDVEIGPDGVGGTE